MTYLSRCLSKEPNFTELESLCEAYDQKSNGAIVGALASQGEIFSFHLDMSYLNFRRGRCFIDGSGSAQFQRVAENDKYKESRQEQKINQYRFGVGKLGLWALHQLSELTFLEASGWPSLENNFGCGYDLAVMLDGRFYRIGSLRTVVYVVQPRFKDGEYACMNVAPYETMFMQSHRSDGTIFLRKYKLDHLDYLNDNYRTIFRIVSTEERTVRPTIIENRVGGVLRKVNFIRVVFVFPLVGGGYYRKAAIVTNPSGLFNFQMMKNEADGQRIALFEGSDKLFSTIDIVLKELFFVIIACFHLVLPIRRSLLTMRMVLNRSVCLLSAAPA